MKRNMEFGHCDNKIVVANWKSSVSALEIDLWLEQFGAHNELNKSNIIVCPPYTHIAHVARAGYVVCAQDCSAWGQKHAPTGDVTAYMLKSMGCDYVIIGHSERRTRLAENLSIVYEKLNRVLECDITPILCVGELIEGSAANSIDNILNELQSLGKMLKDVIVAYEPVWAVGTGQLPSPSCLELTINSIKSHFSDTKIIYGGSVNSMNIESYLQLKNLSGFLVGRASLNPEEFLQIALRSMQKFS